MGASKKPEITLELTGGSLTIRAAEAIYHIVVRGGLAPALPAGEPRAALPSGAEAPALAPPQDQGQASEAAMDDDWDDLDLSLPDEPPADAPGADLPEGAPEDDEYYRDLSHDMFREVGRLARRLSMSIRDVEVDKVESLDFEAAGDQLENAKDQLESVVKMTEKATLKIMDLGEAIQSSISRAREIMKGMAEAGEGEAPAAEPDADAEAAVKELNDALEALTGFLAGLNGQAYGDLAKEAEAIKAELASAKAAPVAEPAPEPEPAGPAYDFPLDLIFQTAYELCTNEAVKKHIKIMWDSGEKDFAPGDVSKALNAIATMEPDEDNFLNLNLKDVLKALFAATSNDKFKQILKKMASTADQIFLDQFLPIEAVPASGNQPAAPAAPAPAPAAPAGPSPEVLARLDDLAAKLMEAAQKASPPPEAKADLAGLLQKALASAVSAGGSVGVDPQSLADLEDSLNTVFTDVNSIIEALSFQDLSGQAIYKIVMMLTDFQVQLLAMVVSFGSKIKTKESDKKATPDQSEKLAQEEVDRVMGSLKAHGDEDEEEEGPGKLDQGAVNDLLDNLGF